MVPRFVSELSENSPPLMRAACSNKGRPSPILEVVLVVVNGSNAFFLSFSDMPVPLSFISMASWSCCMSSVIIIEILCACALIAFSTTSRMCNDKSSTVPAYQSMVRPCSPRNASFISLKLGSCNKKRATLFPMSANAWASDEVMRGIVFR